MKQIYVGNIAFQAGELELKLLFEQFGQVEDVKLIKDIKSGHPKSFAFIQMEESAANKAIENLNESTFGGRKLVVNEARQQNND